MKMKPILLALAVMAGFSVGGCVLDQSQVPPEYTRYIAVIPPNSLYQCPAKPAAPDADTLTDTQVAEYLVKLDNGYSICSRSLKAIKAFADGAALSVQKNRPQD